jgi:glucose/arabinose dehydrogenase/mono/diheme cytochrome c family protein
MKNKFIWCALLLTSLQSEVGHAAITHRWSLNEASGTNVLDSVGTAHGFISVVGTGVDYSRGSGFVRLAGGTWAQTDFVQLPGGLVSSLTNVTIEVWATPRAVQNWARIFDFGPGNGTVQANDFYLSFCRGTSLAQQRLEHDPSPYWRVDTDLPTTVSNQYHYVVVWSKTGGPNGGGYAAWYRDGVLAGSVDTGNRTITNVNDAVMWLGRSQFTSDNTASADYNEVRIYSHALSSNEVNFSRSNGPDTFIAPPTQAANLVITTNVNTLSLTWTPGAGSSGSIIVMRAGQATSVQPNYGTNYPASNVFGSGTDLGSGNYVVFSAAGSNVTITNVTPGVTYFATVYAYSGSGASRVLNLADAPTASRMAMGTVQSVALTTPPQLSLGSSAAAGLQATFVGGSGSVDVTSLASFTSSASNVISISSNGIMTALNQGNAWIGGIYAGFSASNLVTVVDPIMANLRHRYPFSTDANDVVGTAHGTLQGAASIANGQLMLNGTTPYLSLPTGIVAGLSNITLEVWLTNTVSAMWSRIWDFGESTSVNMFLTPLSGGGTIRHALSLTGNGGEQRVNGTAALPLNVRKHIVLTQNGTTGILYVDGVPVGTNTTLTLNPATLGSTTQNYLGKSQYAADPYFTGSMDEFRIYDTALPATLVLSNFLAGPNALPIAPPTTVNDVVTLNPSGAALVPVLANDTGPAGVAATLTVVNPPASGTAVVKPDGKILYTHNGNPATLDLFTYRVQGITGQTSAVATVTVNITPELRLPATTLNLPATPPPVGYEFVNAFPNLNFEDAMAIATPPGRTNQIFVVERRGIISCIPDIYAATPVRQVFLNITNQVAFDDTAQGELGLQSMAFHPGFVTNGQFFVFYVANGGSPYIDRLSRFTADPVALTVNTNTQEPFFSVVDQVFNHNGGDLQFGPDGYLYIGTGDEGDQYNFRQNAQRIDKDLFSALLRIDVDRRPGNFEPKPSANTTTIHTNLSGTARYRIPTDNPFVNATNFLGTAINTNTLRAEIFALGFRHIWRFSIDAPTGDIWVGDVGQDWFEEVNLVTNGGNYGWAYHEGLSNTVALYPSQTTLLSNPPPSYVHAKPVYSYLHTGLPGDAQYKGNSITGGFLYRGNRIPSLTGAYIFADFVSANVWALWRTNNTTNVLRIAGLVGAAGFGRDPGNGDVLVANYVFNRIDRLVQTEPDSSFPQTLTETGAFADVPTLTPNPGVVNYDPNVPFWSDHAQKRRWLAQPSTNAQVTFSANGNWGLPDGMVWIKHFDMELERGNPATKKRLETRFLVKNSAGSYGVSYAWNAAGTEAYLVNDSGTNFNLTITNSGIPTAQNWEIPSRSACLACHTAVGGHALSFNTAQLNRTGTMNNLTGNQLETLADAGFFSNALPDVRTLSAYATATNSAYSLEYRVRSYLSVNCVQCHQPGGPSPGTWDARSGIPLEATSLINGLANNNGANPLNKLIVPGDLNHSIVLNRIKATNGFSRMPPLGSSVLDQSAIDLLTAWISSDLTNRQFFADWQVAHFGATNAPNAGPDQDPDGDGANNYYEFLTQTPPLSNSVPWSITIDRAGSNVNVSFLRLANVGFAVETSDNFADWSLWDGNPNPLGFGASNQWVSLSGLLNRTETNRFFRVKLTAP